MLKGSIVALVTPFKNSQIDYNALDKLLKLHLDQGTDAVLLCGTTGESPALAEDEKDFFIKYCLRKLAGRLPVIVGTGTNNLSRTIAATLKAQKAGADYALVITPYYNKPTQKGLYEFFYQVEAEVDIPLIIYNVPGRTGVNINTETTVKLAKDCVGIVAIKEASGNIVQASEIIRDAPADFALFSGEDALNLALMACGAVGTVSVTANIVPQKVHSLIHHCLENKFEQAKQEHLALLELNRIMFIETNPIPAKEALAMMGLIEREFRSPMTTMSDDNLLKLQQTLHDYKLVK
ncbi:MAG: 4-hydroxy-tetrahydrodipicolinate synthase [Candidatus Cloacimonetes bacterium]|nr:4-hydroxy-tetrahydrodipicolinate synthase [Candidatus Cloacimonadota bacterium]